MIRMKGILFLCITIFIASIQGCGYTLHKRAALPFESVRIGEIINTTSEPKLQDKIYVALNEEFLRQGIRVTDLSKNVLEGQINYFSLRILSEKSDLAREYEVEIRGNFTFRNDDGKVNKIKAMSSPFYETYHTPDIMNDIVAAKEKAEEKALRTLSMRLVADLIYARD